jgi:hypothetical protein
MRDKHKHDDSPAEIAARVLRSLKRALATPHQQCREI